jgi:putative ABC transport system permease protein
VIGVVLAITFVSGTCLAIDSSARSSFEALLYNPWGDYGITAFQGNWTDIRDAALAVPGVTDVVVYRQIGGLTIWKENDSSRFDVSFYGIDPSDPPSIPRDATIIGSLELPRGNVALGSEAASILDVRIGGVVTYEYSEFDMINGTFRSRLLNLTVAAIVTPAQSSYYGGNWNYWIYSFVNINDIDWVGEQLGMPASCMDLTQGEVWIDHARFLDPYDLAGTERNLARIGRQLEAALAPYAGYVQDNLSGSISLFSMTLTIQRLVFLALSLPVILLGLYLGIIGAELGHAERRRELAVLKTRGARERQIIGVLIMDAILGGVLATAIGIPLGLVFSRFIVGYVNPSASGLTARYNDIVLSLDTIVSVLILSIVLMAGISYRSAKRTANLPIVETLKYYAPGETKIHYKPSTDIILVALSVFTYGVVIWSRSAPADFMLFLIGMIFTVLLPFAPIFLIVGTTRLLTRATGRVYEWTARVCKPVAKNLYYIISRNLSRNPRRSANIALIIALGLGFGIFVFATLGSQQAYQESQVRASIGADMSISPPSSDETFRSNLTSLPQVAAVTKFEFAEIVAEYGYTRVCVLEADSYFAVTQPEPWYFESLDSQGAKAVLKTEGQVLVSRSYLDANYLAVGDRIALDQTLFNGTDSITRKINVTIGGVVKTLPGIVIGQYYVPAMIYVSNVTVRELFESPLDYEIPFDTTYLVDLKQGADWRAAKADVQALGASGIRVYQEELEQATSGPLFSSLFGFIYVEIAYIIVILTVGIGLIIYAATIERDVEFAAITARGSTGWQTAGLLVGEALSIMLIGLLVGLSIGLVSSYLTSLAFFGGSIGGVQSLVPYPFRIPVETLYLLVLAPTAMLLTVFLVSWRVAKMDIARVLKLRGG